MLRLLMIGSLVGVQCVAQVAPDDTGLRGNLRIIAVDPFGDRLVAPDITIHRVDASKKPESIVGTPNVTLEYGRYTVQIAQSGFEIVVRTLQVEAPDASVVVALRIGDIEKTFDHTIVEGRTVQTDSEMRCNTIRLVPLFLKIDPFDIRLSPAGHFVLKNVDAGAYMAVFIGPSGVCRTSNVKILKRQFQTLVVGGEK
jgi:hypothetical protein